MVWLQSPVLGSYQTLAHLLLRLLPPSRSPHRPHSPYAEVIVDGVAALLGVPRVCYRLRRPLTVLHTDGAAPNEIVDS